MKPITTKILPIIALCLLAVSAVAVPTRLVHADTCPSGTRLLPDVSSGVQNCMITEGADAGKIAGSIDGSGAYVPNAAPTNDLDFGKAAPQLAACQKIGWWDHNWLKCAFDSLVITLFSSIISFFGFLVDVSGYLFNQAIRYTILDFSTWFEGISGAVTNGWTVFRDLSNILIIGFFVFIAISIILGLQEYGQRKLIARVIIVAILINFSFLFTLIAINASNAIATGIYNQMGINATTNNDSLRGLGDQFRGALRVNSLRDTADFLVKVRNEKDWSSMFTYALLAALFTLLLAGVFLFGAFLLIARFITLILLLILSAAAFATYLIPAFAEAGWSKWWHELLRNSFLAPVMMLFLAISLGIANSIAPQGAGQSLGAFAANPNDPNGWGLVMMFILLIGVLFGGMYIASQMAGGLAKRVAAFGTALPVGIGGRIAGAGLRWTRGRGADARATDLDTRIGTERTALAQRMLEQKKAADAAGKPWAGPSSADIAPLTKLLRQQTKAKQQAGKSYELSNLPGVGEALKAAGLPAALAGASKESYAKTAHAEAEKAARQALATGISKAQADEAAKNIPTPESAEHETSEKLLQTAQESVDYQRKTTGLLEKLQQHQGERDTALKELATVRQEMETGPQTEERKQAYETRMNELRGKILRAKEAAQKAEQDAMRENPQLREAVTFHKDALKHYNETKEKLNEARKDTAESLRQVSAAVVKQSAEKLYGSPLTRLMTRIGVTIDKTGAHHATELAAKRYQVKDKADEKRELDEYNKFISGGDSHGNDHSADKGGKDAKGGGDHH